MTYMLLDLTPLMEKLNLTVQPDDVNLADVQSVVDGTKASLQHLLTTPGLNEQEFSTTVTWDGGMFQIIKLTYCDRQPVIQQAWTACIQRLFPAFSVQHIIKRPAKTNTNRIMC